ncbi:hypothetical protein WME95_08450 [Sorangium sp. So ce327]|uniref:hypothetical protein n=1 Tax=Sorangium sp. So ce327 TaxID=3133301 RepID=UPI003F5FFFD8
MLHALAQGGGAAGAHRSDGVGLPRWLSSPSVLASATRRYLVRLDYANLCLADDTPEFAAVEGRVRALLDEPAR